MDKKTKHEVLQLILSITSGQGTTEERSRLSQLVEADEEAAEFAVQALHQEASLTRQAFSEPLESVLAEVAQCPAPSSCVASPVGHASALDKSSTALSTRPRKSMGWLPLAATLLLAVGAAVGGAGAYWAMRDGMLPSRQAQASQERSQVDDLRSRRQLYLAKFVEGTGCVWEPGSMPPVQGGSSLQGGDSFNLMEGLAKIELSLPSNGTASLTMEGPARMILRSEGIPSLTQGKFTANVRSSSDTVSIDLPLGQLQMSEDSSVGVMIRGLEVEVHVFSGGVDVACPWLQVQDHTDSLYVTAGKSLRLFIVEEETRFLLGDAQGEFFASQSTMRDDLLEVTEEYVSAVRNAAPIVYWRFDDAARGIVRNDASDRYHGVVAGKPGWPLQGRNRAIEFGVGHPTDAKHAYIALAEPFGEEFSDAYAVELWVKPSHYHWGSLLSVYHPDYSGAHHGVLLELGGTPPSPTIIEHPGRVRFLHRDPPTDDKAQGTSCFSEEHYELRRWTHVVAVKDKAEMRLYLDGRLVASCEESSSLAPGLTLTLGQLDRHRHSRAFIGQIDELAIYDRALGAEEIRNHYLLLRTPKRILPTPAI